MQVPSPEQKARGRTESRHRAHEAALARRRALESSRPSGRRRDWRDGPDAARDGLVAHYELDGNLADSSGHYPSRAHREGRSELSNGRGGPRRGFRRRNARDLRTRAAFDGNDPFSIAFWMQVEQKAARDSARSRAASRSRSTISNSPGFSSACRGSTSRCPNGLDGANRESSALAGEHESPGGELRRLGGARAVRQRHACAAGNRARSRAGQAPRSAQPPRSRSTPFKGTLDDLRIYNRGLPPAEIASLQTSGPAAGHPRDPARRSGRKSRRPGLRDYYLTSRRARIRRAQAWAELKALREEEKS